MYITLFKADLKITFHGFLNYAFNAAAAVAHCHGGNGGACREPTQAGPEKVICRITTLAIWSPR